MKGKKVVQKSGLRIKVQYLRTPFRDDEGV